jgi:hypothetical protein
MNVLPNTTLNSDFLKFLPFEAVSLSEVRELPEEHLPSTNVQGIWQ